MSTRGEFRIVEICTPLRKSKYVGSYLTVEEAKAAYAEMAKLYFGDFARF